MKKLSAMLLALVLALSAIPALAADYDELTVGCTTALSGRFFTNMWGENTADQDVRALLHGYQLVEWKSALGTYAADEAVVSGILLTQDEAGNRTYSIALYDDLRYCDGTPITAWDYAFSVLLGVAPEVREIGGAVQDRAHILGMAEYLSGEAQGLAGLRVISDTMLEITIEAQAYPNFYEMTLINAAPYPIGEIAPGCEVADEGSGAFIRNADPTVAEPIFTADLLRETILDPETGYLSHPRITSGPYVLTAYDAAAGTAEFAINEHYKGNSDGKLPLIPRLVLKPVKNETMIQQLADGEVGLLNKCVHADAVDSGMQLVMQQQAGVSNYARSGLSFISFSCERPAVASQAVRQAIALCMDREGFIQSYVRNYGMEADGWYGIGQWMFRMVAGSMVPPVEEPAPDADDAALAAYDQALLDWAALNLDGLQRYPLDLAAAEQLLIDDGWTLNREGAAFDRAVDSVRCKEMDGALVELDLHMIYPQQSAAGQALQGALVDNLWQIGAALTIEEKPMEELLQIYYRQVPREYDMIYLATNFSDVFNLAPSFQPGGADNRTAIADEQLYRLALELQATEPGNLLLYCQRWVALQQRFSQLLPAIPLYTNIYFDFYTPALHDYYAGAETGWARAIIGAYLSDAAVVEEAAPEDQDAIFEDDGAVFEDGELEFID